MKKVCVLALLAAAPVVAQAQETYVLPPTVITATGRPEQVTKIAGTIQVIPKETIEKSTARSVTELFAENAVGFMSEWTAGQTSLNIRGAATEGQGRDFRSQVLVLINGHRAGTANISKLSLSDVERIEIVRGPSSVVYGSQNMGGVVNIILKTGRTAPGSFLEVSGGSWATCKAAPSTAGPSTRSTTTSDSPRRGAATTRWAAVRASPIPPGTATAARWRWAGSSTRSSAST